MFVCMNTYISQIISATIGKVGDNVFYFDTQIINILKFGHALFRPHESIIFEFHVQF